MILQFRVDCVLEVCYELICFVKRMRIKCLIYLLGIILLDPVANDEDLVEDIHISLPLAIHWLNHLALHHVFEVLDQHHHGRLELPMEYFKLPLQNLILTLVYFLFYFIFKHLAIYFFLKHFTKFAIFTQLQLICLVNFVFEVRFH